MGHIGSLMRSRAWFRMAPDYANVVVTSAKGLGILDYKATARTSDGETVMVWNPTVLPITVNMTQIGGADARAWWWDPDDNSSASIGTFETSGTRIFPPPSPGVVLVLDDESKGLAAPGTTTYTPPPPSYDVWISSDQSGSPFIPFHDCVRFDGSVMSTDLCGDAGTVARFPLLSVSGLELWIAQVPCQGLNLVYIGTTFAGEALPLGGNSIAASIIGTTLGNTLGMEGFENGSCTISSTLSDNPYAGGEAGRGRNPGEEWGGLSSQADPEATLGSPGEAETVANKTYKVWASRGSGAAPFVPGQDCVRFTGATISSDACGDVGLFVEFPLFSTPGLTLWIGSVPCQGANLVYFGTSYDGAAVLPLGGNVMSASVVGLSQGWTLSLEGFENPSCSIVP